ncbi:hypothetical protein ACFQXA_33345 [Nocardiopsis composta]
MKNTSGGAQAVPGAVSGEFDFAFGNVTSLLVARDSGLPVQTVANGVSSTGKDGEDFEPSSSLRGATSRAPRTWPAPRSPSTT